MEQMGNKSLLSFHYEGGRKWRNTFIDVMGKLEFMGVSVRFGRLIMQQCNFHTFQKTDLQQTLWEIGDKNETAKFIYIEIQKRNRIIEWFLCKMEILCKTNCTFKYILSFGAKVFKKFNYTGRLMSHFRDQFLSMAQTEKELVSSNKIKVIFFWYHCSISFYHSIKNRNAFKIFSCCCH